MSKKPLPKNIKQEFVSGRWRETSPGKWVNREGYALTDLGGSGWRLSAPGGAFIADQLSLFKLDKPVTEWADQYIKSLPNPA